MESTEIHIHAFKVQHAANSQTLESLLNVIDSDALAQRVRHIGVSDVRLEQIEHRKRRSNGERRIYLDFVRLRDTHGPGKASINKPIEGFHLGTDEFFGEETAALFIPATNWIIVQYNHFGVRPGQMALYFSHYKQDVANAYDFAIRLDQDVERRFRKQQHLRRISLAVDLNRMSSSDRTSGESLAQIARLGSALGANKLNVTLSVGYDRTASLAHNVKQALKGLIDGHPDAITHAEVSGRETTQGEIEVVDLIDEKLVHTEQVTIGEDRRLPFSGRCAALLRAYSQWRTQLTD